MDNNSSYKIADIGTIKIKMFEGIVRTLTNVRHIPDLKRNLISLSTPDSNVYKFIDEGGVIRVSRGAFVVMKGTKQHGQLYVLQGFTVISDASVSTFSLFNIDLTYLWHMHLGHMSEISMTELSKIALLEG